ncbi:hypothetical protein N7530_006966 [Penicillium desertorum]|uniref:Pre-rRNA-processing protein IPI3 n=1 Tax=Penicillium desertorum TaxID=1303715 RepID=A0A9W9WSR4_9EURO|nr:hypothetical protein N7530_006966 [Penicillium desertorum]
MLSESFVASTLSSAKSPTASLRDVGVCIHELQPSSILRSTFKKSSTLTNCLAVSPSHIFTAQADKAVLHVYNREKGNQEGVVPFPERIRSIAVAGGQTCTGRQVATTASHLQPVTSLVVDPTSNFILSGSADASVHVWSLPGILSFSKPALSATRQPTNSPIRTFSNHRAAITSLAVGHSNGRHNIVVSTAKDNTAIAWDYHTGRALRTFLLPLSATSVALDPVDRAFYVGYEDGSVQSVDFYRSQSAQHPLHDPSVQSTPAQVSMEDRWLPSSAETGSAKAISLTYDGTTLLSGHANGKVLSWNVARRKYTSSVADYTHPITNLVMLPPGGIPHPSSDLKRKAHTIVKPRHDNHCTVRLPQTNRILPGAYPLLFPTSMFEDGLAELAAFRQPGSAEVPRVASNAAPARETLEDTAARDSQVTELENEVAVLKKKVAVNETARHNADDEVVQLRSDLANLQDYINELHEKQEAAQQEKVLRQARKQEHETKKREAWLAAEKKGLNGDAVVQKMDIDGAVTSDSDDPSDE